MPICPWPHAETRRVSPWAGAPAGEANRYWFNTSFYPQPSTYIPMYPHFTHTSSPAGEVISAKRRVNQEHGASLASPPGRSVSQSVSPLAGAPAGGAVRQIRSNMNCDAKATYLPPLLPTRYEGTDPKRWLTRDTAPVCPSPPPPWSELRRA
ncbi:hypothetical protein LZ30DRAFT_97662 [Colletotrichum cereale]|nr:hypothetical protein LZ30DRAFT_97662 [Colletotrichum cereale]